MKSGHMYRALLACAGSLVVSSTAQAGDLNPPPGAIQATDRITLNAQAIALPHLINQPGSYVLTSNFAATVNAVGFQIDADNVTLDLNGFTIDGAGVGGSGIFVVAGRNNVSVRNGTITNWQDIGFNAPFATSCRLVDVHVSDCGLGGFTISSGNILTRCAAWNNGGFGIEGSSDNSYVQCVCNNNTTGGISTGLSSTLQDCIASDNGNVGFVADNGSSIVNCTAQGNPGTGIIVGNGCVVSRCAVRETGDGISAPADVLIEDNIVHIGTGRGIRVTFDGCRVVNNHITDFQTGIDISAPNGGSFVSNNLVRSNVTNYSFTQGNQLELVIAELPQTISWTAKVILRGSLNGPAAGDGITVAANDVTIDLNGFSLTGVPGGAFSGIAVQAGFSNPTIKNGTVRGFGAFGIEASGANNGQYFNLHLQENGSEGIFAGPNSVVERCTASANSIGFHLIQGSVIRSCTSQSNLADGFIIEDGSLAERCTSRDNSGSGFAAIFGATIDHCISRNNAMHGVFADFGNVVTECAIRENQMAGIQCFDENVISNNRVALNGGPVGGPRFGIEVIGIANRIDGNDCKFQTNNIFVGGPSNTIYSNSATGGAPNYNIAAGNDIGPIAPAAAALANCNVTY